MIFSAFHLHCAESWLQGALAAGSGAASTAAHAVQEGVRRGSGGCQVWVRRSCWIIRGGEGTILGGRTNKHPRLVHPLKGVGGYINPLTQGLKA